MTKKKTNSSSNTKGTANKTTGKTSNKAQQTQQGGIPTLPIEIHSQYVKDISFETPGPLGIKHHDQQPEISLNVEVKANNAGQENSFEVELHISASAKNKEETMFILELAYAGIFTLHGIEKETIAPVLLIECPRILFPFARSIVANVTRDGGFPPLAIAPIDFAEIYRKQLSNMQAQQTAKASQSK